MRIAATLVFLIGAGVLLGTATAGKLALLCFSTLLMGLSLSVLTSMELQQLPSAELNTELPTIVISLACFGAYAGALTAVGDKTHFMNRDDPLWSYLSIGFSCLLLLIGVGLSFLPIKRC